MVGVNVRNMQDDGERCQGSGVVEANIDAIPPTRLSSALAIVLPPPDPAHVELACAWHGRFCLFSRASGVGRNM